MDSETSATLSCKAGSASTLTPSLKSIDDLIIIKYVDPITNTNRTHFLFVTEQDEVFFGRASKDTKEMTLDEYANALRHVPDAALFPEVPEDRPLSIAVDDKSSYFCKRAGLLQYEPELNTGTPKQVLDETLIMELLSKHPHPNIIHYHGCRVRRGRITAILLEKHAKTLVQFVSHPSFESLDQDAFLTALESAVDHLHSLGLAHNDINPYNIMINKNNMPVLIDFGSCQPFGKYLQTFGSPGWVEEDFRTSEKKHDIFALGKLRQWLHKAKSMDSVGEEDSVQVEELVKAEHPVKAEL
ncbi:hypothetical protein G3M48_001602 [Beauveria asiatica]|uniref:Protein kinase domain-containing protein n=1 Tax=Beauveria asiatica TaxID=1069075 RepID=A0AAW0RYV5_9HYPO